MPILWSGPSRPIDFPIRSVKDHKIIAVATDDPEFNAYHESHELPQHRLLMVRCFFREYKQLEGKPVEVDEIESAASAYRTIQTALQDYRKKCRGGLRTL
ncbi:MAG: hypothetical protein DMG30_10870 [Acidobacteria bacterium]|nr:MAG: hypothetical protein DMG30_10870 [Acidobacteriota bacterium]